MQPMNFSLNAADILRHSQAPSLGLEIEVVQSTGSTNADLRANLAHLSGPRLLVAENQTAGRGRAGRSWQAESGSSLCFSLAWQFQGALSSLTGLSLAVGVSLAQTLIQQGFPVQLKWPNDLLKDGLKLGGVLIESVPVRSQQNAVWAIIGIGLNTQLSENLCASVGHDIAALSMQTNAQPIAQPMDRNKLCAQLVDGLIQALQEFQLHGLKNFIAPWQQYHAYANQVVSITEQGRLLHEGLASGIDADGRLLLQSLTTPTKFTAIAVGDVSLRLA
jgi:BirA family transcriptional regulator, biotin operon repressor / biotin---[acetyl-CoA-carboxylase] ligase